MSFLACNEIVSDGVTTNYPISWVGSKPSSSELPYLEAAHIKVYAVTVNEYDLEVSSYPLAFILVAPLEIQLSSVVNAGKLVRIIRETPDSYNLTRFSNTALKPRDFELMQRQLLFISQENSDTLELYKRHGVVIGVVNTTVVTDNLNSYSPVEALSANQGRILKENTNAIVPSAEAARDAAIAAKVAAEAAKDIAQLSSGVFDTVSAGLAGTTNGTYFSVPQAAPSSTMYDLYRNTVGVAVYINSYSSTSLVSYAAYATNPHSFVDHDGFILASIAADGTFKTTSTTTKDGLVDTGKFSMAYLTDQISQAFTLSDLDGFIFAVITALGKLQTTAFTLDAGVLDASTWAIKESSAVDGYAVVDADGFILLAINQTTGLRAVGLASSSTPVSTLPHARKIVLFGDSRTEQNSVSPLSSQRMTRMSDFGYANWAHYFTNANFELIANAGISGNTTSQMLGRFNTDVLPLAPDELWGEAGINDVGAGTAEATTKANLASIFDLCDANGIYVRWSTISPLYTGQANLTPSNVAKITNINRWLREQAVARKNLTIVDSWAELIDKTSTTGSALSGVLQTDDNIHQSPKGAKLQGKAYAKSFIADHSLIDYLPQYAGDSYANSSASKQLLDNPLFTTTTGGTNNSLGVVVGTLPLGIRISAAGTWGLGAVNAAVVARADGVGFDLVLTVANAGAANDTLTIAFDDLSSRVTNGDSLVAMCELSISNLSKNRGFKLEMASSVADVYEAASMMEYTQYQPTGITPDPQTAWSDDMYNQADITGVIKTPKRVLASSGAITNTYPVLTFRFGGVGSTATIKIGRVAVYKN